MDAQKEDKLFYLAIGLCILVLVAYFGGNFMLDRLSDKVIIKIKRQYTPGPYQPGFDPDIVPSKP